MIDLLINLAGKFFKLNPGSLIARGIVVLAILASAIAYGYKLGHGHASGDCAIQRETARTAAIERQMIAIKRSERIAEANLDAATIVINGLDQARKESNARINQLLNRPKVVCNDQPVISPEWMLDFTAILNRTRIAPTETSVPSSAPD